VTSQSHHLTSLALVNIRQEKGESLRAFMERFGKVTLNIKNFNHEVTLHDMVTTLSPRPFPNDLCMTPAANLDKLAQHAAKFM